METNEKKHRSFSTHLIAIIRGLFLGWSNCLPFFSVSSLKECMKKNDDVFEGNNFGERLLFQFKQNYTYFIGFIIGFLLFFFIPVKTLEPFYPIAIYAGMGAMILPFLATEIFRFVRSFKKEMLSIILSAGIFVAVFGLCMLLYFALSNVEYPEYSGFSFGVILVYLFITIATFITCFSGLSVGTLLFFLVLYIPYADNMRTFMYNDTSFLPLVIFSLLGLLSGFVLNQVVVHFIKKDLTMEKGASAIAFYVAGLIIILATKIHEPWYVEDKTVTEIAQMYTILTSVIACFFLAIALSIHRIPFFNKKDYNELNNIQESEENEA